MIADLSEEIGTEMLRADGIDDTRAHLDNGNFARVFEKYMNIKETTYMIDLGHFASGTYACVLLAAAAMLVGAKISEEHKLYLKKNYKACGLMKGGIGQMSKALEEYTNGKPYELEEPDRTDQIRERTSREAVAKESVSDHFW